MDWKGKLQLYTLLTFANPGIGLTMLAADPQIRKASSKILDYFSNFNQRG